MASVWALVIANAQDRLRLSKKVVRKKVTSGPTLPGKLADCTSQDTTRTELFLVEGDFCRRAPQAGAQQRISGLHLRGKILNTWEVEPAQVLGSQEVHDIALAIGVEPGSQDLSGSALWQDLHPR